MFLKSKIAIRTIIGIHRIILTTDDRVKISYIFLRYDIKSTIHRLISANNTCTHQKIR